jgi:hypothetical protein
MKPLTSVAAFGLLPVPLMSNALRSRDFGHCAETEHRSKSSGLAWLPQDATQRLEMQAELAPARCALRMAMLRRATASLLPGSHIVNAFKTQADAMPLWYLWLLAVMGSLGVVGSASWMVTGLSIGKHLLGIAGTALYATIMTQAVYGLTHRWR